MTMPAGRQVLEHLLAHLGGRAHGDHLHAARRRKVHRAGDQDHARAARGGGFGQRVAHLAAGTVGDVAHRVERLLGGAGGDQHGFAFQVAAPARFALDGLGDGLRIGQAARAGHAAGQVAALRLHDAVAAPAQRFQVGLRGGVLPHVDVHGGRHHHRAGEGQVERGEEIVRQAVGQLGDQVGRGRRDHQQLVLLGHGDVLDGALDGEQIGEHLAAGERGEGQRPDELLRGRGHDGLHLVALLHQQARQLGGLIGRDAAADAQDDLHAAGLQRRLRPAAVPPAPGR